jgi:acyl phosphate:glycerol-3-phosphate acyltransferase
MDMWLPFVVVALAYGVGSLSFAVVVSRFMGLDDPRSYGSGNPGATNVLRSGSKKAAALTLLMDAAKGGLPVWAVLHWGPEWSLGAATAAWVGLAAFMGHLFPVFFRFKGGKGVATAAGVLVAYEPLLGLAVLVSWLMVAVFTRYSSLAAIVAAVFAPFYYLFGDGVSWRAEPPIALAMGVMGVLLIWRHAANIQRLFAGTEGRIGGSKKT